MNKRKKTKTKTRIMPKKTGRNKNYGGETDRHGMTSNKESETAREFERKIRERMAARELERKMGERNGLVDDGQGIYTCVLYPLVVKLWNGLRGVRSIELFNASAIACTSLLL